MSPNNRYLATTGNDGKLRIWPIGSREDEHALPLLLDYQEHDGAVLEIDFSPNGDRVASAGSGNVINIWNAQTGVTEQSINVNQGSESRKLFARVKNIHGLYFRSDGKRLLCLSDFDVFSIWDSVSGECVSSGTKDTYKYRAAYHPTKEIGVSVSGSSIGFWRDAPLPKWEMTKYEDNGWAGTQCVDFSPDGRRLVSGNSIGMVDILDSSELTNARVEDIRIHRCAGHSKSVRCVMFGPKGERVFSGSDDGTVRIWDAETGSSVRVLDDHSSTVTSIDVSGDGQLLASASQDGTVKLWNAETGDRLLLLSEHDGPVNDLAFHPEKPWLATCGADGRVKIWDVSSIIADLSGGDRSNAVWIDGRDRLRHGHQITFIDDAEVMRDGKLIDVIPAGWTTKLRYPKDGRFQVSFGKVGWVDQMAVHPFLYVESHFSAQVEKDPTSVKWRLARAMVRHRRGKLAAARTELDELVEEDSNHLWCRLARGRLRLDQDDVEGAIEDFTTAIEANPQDPHGYMYRGMAWDQRGDGVKALADHDAAVEHDSDRATVYYERGRTHARSGRHKKAIADFNRAIQIDPEYTAAYLATGDAHLEKGYYGKALVNYDVAAALEWMNPDVFAARADAYLKVGNDKSDGNALKDSAYALKRRPNNKRAHRVQAIALALTGNGISELSELIEEQGEDSSLLFSRGRAYQKTQEWNLAVQDFSRVIELVPPAPHAFGRRAIAWEGMGEQQKANDDMTFAIENSGTFRGHWLRERAKMWESRGQPEKAQKDLKAAEEIESQEE